MGRYIVKRLLLLIPTLFLVCFIIFSLMRMVPGSAVDVIVDKLSASSGAVDRDAVEAMLGLDQPFFKQFASWISDLLHGDMGTSIFQAKSVTKIIASKLPATIELVILTMIISVLISIPLGLICAAYQDSISDKTIRVISVLMMSIPMFWLATIVLVYPATWWGYVPPTQYVSIFENPAQNLRMFLPAAVLGGISNAGGTLRNVRTLTLEVLRQDYIRTAWSKGLKEKLILFRHAFRNTLIPVITMIGGSINSLLGGTVILETLFSIPGIGSELTDSLSLHDYPVVQGCVLLMAIIGMIITLIVDVTYKVVDPRVKLE